MKIKRLTRDEFLDLQSILQCLLPEMKGTDGLITTAIRPEYYERAKLFRPHYVIQHKSVKITKAQLDAHRAKHGFTPEQKAVIMVEREMNLYGRSARMAKKARKADIKQALAEKNTRPKGRYYDPMPDEALARLFKPREIDENQPEAEDWHRVQHFGDS